MHCALCTVECTHSNTHTHSLVAHTVHCALCTVECTLHTSHFTLHTAHCTLHTPLSTLHTPHSTLHTPHSALHTHTYRRTNKEEQETQTYTHIHIHTIAHSAVGAHVVAAHWAVSATAIFVCVLTGECERADVLVRNAHQQPSHPVIRCT